MNPVFDEFGAQWNDGLAEIEALLEAALTAAKQTVIAALKTLCERGTI